MVRGSRRSRENLPIVADFTYTGLAPMEFHLIYDGPLSSASNNSRKEEKHQIRLALHPQLTELWRTDPTLLRLQGIWQQHNLVKIGNFIFMPLVTSKRYLHCHLEITFLRPGPLGRLVLQGGDIDNRLKTLFDALRVPQGLDEIPGASPLGPGIICCLLEDDSLISGFNVQTDQLLGGEAGGGEAIPSSRVHLLLRVIVKSSMATF